MHTRTKLVRYFEIARVLLFLAGIVIPGLSPLVIEVLERSGAFPRGKRAPFPKVTAERAALLAFPSTFKAYLNENFGLRQTLIYGQAAFRYFCLRVPTAQNVILGTQDNWLFYADSESRISLRNAKPYTEQELAQWRQVLEARNQILNQSGIQYLVVIAPDKHTVYPEYVPAPYTRLHPKSRREQLCEYLKVNSKVQFIDLTDALRQAKSSGRLYIKSDTHWNDRGAFYAFQVIGRRIQDWYPQFQSPSLSAFDLVEKPFSGSDLSLMLGLRHSLPEPLPTLVPRTPFKAQPLKLDLLEHFDLIGQKYLGTRAYATQCPEAKLDSAVLLHDSFAEFFSRYISEEFKQVVCLPATYQDFPTEFLLQSRPQIVIQESVERFLSGDLPTLP